MKSRTTANLSMTRSRYTGFGYCMRGKHLSRSLYYGHVLVLCI